MNKELEKVMIEDVEYSFDPEKEYIKDGHAYCKVRHERKDGKVMDTVVPIDIRRLIVVV